MAKEEGSEATVPSSPLPRVKEEDSEATIPSSPLPGEKEEDSEATIPRSPLPMDKEEEREATIPSSPQPMVEEVHRATIPSSPLAWLRPHQPTFPPPDWTGILCDQCGNLCVAQHAFAWNGRRMTVCSVCLLVEEVCILASLRRTPTETTRLTQELLKMLALFRSLGVQKRTRQG